MAKDKSLSKEERRAQKNEKKESKLLAQDAGVTKSKSDRKDKKEKKAKREALAEKALNEMQSKQVTKDSEDDGSESEGGGMEVDDSKASEVNDKGKEKKAAVTRPIGALVPFANPLVIEEKTVKKVFKSVKKAAAQRALKRGVKEVVKAVRRAPNSQPASSTTSDPIGVVILAADISPMDVISHIPVLCEDHNIPYAYVTSRAELGMAGQTKRPTSVVMVSRDVGKKKESDKKAEADGEEWIEVYKSLVKTVEKEGRNVRR